MRYLVILWAGFLGAVWLMGCAQCTVQPDGSISGRAFGNAACSWCPPTSPPMRLSDGPAPPPIVPTVREGCIVVQGGSETGNTLVSTLGIVAAFLAGKGL